MCNLITTELSIGKGIRYAKKEDLVYLPKVILVNKFTEDSTSKFAKDMNDAHNTGQPIIPVVIDSYGGYVYQLLAMIDIIRNAKIPVATIVMGKAMSCGSVLMSCGTEGHRYVAPNATVMIHDCSSGSFGKVEEIKADAEETKRLDTLFFKIMANNCGKDDDYFKRIVHEHSHADWYLTPEECVKHNLANHIRVPSFKVNVGLEVSFGS